MCRASRRSVYPLDDVRVDRGRLHFSLVTDGGPLDFRGTMTADRIFGQSNSRRFCDTPDLEQSQLTTRKPCSEQAMSASAALRHQPRKTDDQMGTSALFKL